MALKVCLTSPMTLEAGEKVVEGARLGRPQVRLALALLVTQRARAVSRHELADVLWPGALPTTWEAALRSIVSKVRAIFATLGLPPERVIPGSFGFYQLHLPPDAVVDVDEAASSLARAEATLRAGAAEVAREHADQARAIASRPFLPGEEGEWVERVRAELHGLVVRAVEVLSEARLALGEAVAAAEAAEAVLALEPFRESAHRLLIAAHAAAGNRAEALRAYERCRKIVAEELGVSPSAETEAAYLALLREESGTKAGSRPPDLPVNPCVVPVPDLPPPPGGRLVGRRSEQVRLSDAWRRAREGHRQVVLLAGEAGIGKSALALDLAAAARSEGATVLYGRCDREVCTPYAPFVEALGRYVARCPADRLHQQLAPAGSSLVRLLPELATRLPDVVATAASDPETERHGLFVATCSLLASMAATRPVVLVVDDLQWAGAGALLLLRYATRALVAAPLLIVATYRPEEEAATPILGDVVSDVVREPGAVLVEVTALEETAVVQLVHDACGDGVPSALVARLAEDAAGNPLFLTELLCELQHGGGRGLAAGDHLGAPAAVCRLVNRRRSRLSEAADRALSVASVIGAEFEMETLQGACDLDGDALLDALEDAATAGLVSEADVVTWYRFRHRLVRDAIYDQLSRTRRARLHCRVAEAFVARGEPFAGSRAAEVAHHFYLAGPLAPRGKAAEWALRVAEAAVRQLSYEQAAVLYQRALELGLDEASDQTRRCQGLIGLASALRKAGRVGAARASYLEAVQLARALGDPVALAHCAVGLAAGGRGVSAWIADEVRVGLLEEALAGLDEGDDAWRVKLLAQLTDALSSVKEGDRRDRLAEEAVATARRIGSPAVLADALSATKLLRWGPANTELRLACADEILDLGERAGDRELALRARLGRIGDLVEMGEREAFDSEIRAVMSLAEELHQPYYLWRARAWHATQALIRGELADARARATSAEQVWADEVHADAVSWRAVFDAMVRLLEGRPTPAVRALRRLADAYPTISAYRCLSSLVAVAAGNRIDAGAEFEHFAADGFTSPPLDAEWLFAVTTLAETCALLDDAPRAEALSELLVPFAERLAVLDAFGGGGGFRGPVAHALGLLAATLGRRAEAEERFDQAVEAAARIGAIPCMVRAQRAASGAPTLL